MSILKAMLQNVIPRSVIVSGKSIKRQQTGAEEKKKD